MHLLMGVGKLQESPWEGKYFCHILGKYNLSHLSHREMDCKEAWDRGLRAQGVAPSSAWRPHDRLSPLCPAWGRAMSSGG